MNIAGGVIVYLLLWWTIFFMILPWGVRGRWENPDQHVEGTDPGAPQDPQLWQKVKRTSMFAAFAWLVVAAVIVSGIFDFRD